MPNLLEVKGLCAGYGEVEVLKTIDISVVAGAITAVIGGNGAGKTTLIRALSGLIRPTQGDIIFDGAAVTALPAHERLERGIALVPEGRLMFPDFTVQESLRVGAFAPRARVGWAARVEEMYALFPASNSAAFRARARFRAASSKCWRWRAVSCPAHDCSCSMSRAWDSRPRCPTKSSIG